MYKEVMDNIYKQTTETQTNPSRNSKNPEICFSPFRLYKTGI